MSYIIHGVGENVPEGVTLFAATARDALKKLETIKHRCRPNGRLQFYANGAVISEEQLNQRAQRE